VKGRNNARAGIYGFGQQDDELLGVVFNDASNPNFRTPVSASGSLVALFAEEQFRATSWLTLNAGIRQTTFLGTPGGKRHEPRFGAAVRVPRLNWVFRAFYGHFYQAPPLLTAAGPVVQFVNAQNLSFIPLHGERERGIAIRSHHPITRMDRRRGYFQNAREELLRPQQRGKLRHFLPVDD